MPLIDVSDAICDEMFTDVFQVVRRGEQVGENGRTSIVPTLITPVQGSVQPAGGDDLLRLPESQRVGKHLSIVTTFLLYPASDFMQPDIVVWPPGGNDRYLVTLVDDYSHFGFVQAIASSMRSTEAPPA